VPQDVTPWTKHLKMLSTVWVAVALVVGLAASWWLPGVVAAFVVCAIVAGVVVGVERRRTG
jgi:uncharacterized ion transporter superfamily protein YfcC